MTESKISMKLGDSPSLTNSMKLMGKDILGKNLGSNTLLARLSILNTSG